MKILIFNGSPRTLGSTVKMLESFMMKAIDLGHEVIRYDLDKMFVRPCKACDYCRDNNGKCVLKDDFQILSDDILTADGIVFSAPVFWFSVPAQLKALIDRFYSFQGIGFDLGEKKVAYLSTCVEDTDDAFKAILYALDRSVEFLGWEKVGQVLVKGIDSHEISIGEEHIAKAEELAGKF